MTETWRYERRRLEARPVGPKRGGGFHMAIHIPPIRISEWQPSMRDAFNPKFVIYLFQIILQPSMGRKGVQCRHKQDNRGLLPCPRWCWRTIEHHRGRPTSSSIGGWYLSIDISRQVFRHTVFITDISITSHIVIYWQTWFLALRIFFLVIYCTFSLVL